MTIATHGFLGCNVKSFIVFYPVGRLKVSVLLSMILINYPEKEVKDQVFC